MSDLKSTPEQLEEMRQAQIRESVAIGQMKLLNSARHYVSCVLWSLEGRGQRWSKAVAELELAMAHMNEAGFIVAELGGVKK
ncbi:MAG TPA: hypothetical protein VFG76_08200 [Candidatus Polarisedimenticolia bacterium]|nr:hypothetical protein [Candidatus Polarisedimenticolia bacterium]